MVDLKDVSTSELVKELESREGIQKIKVGLYQEYDIVGKFGTPDFGHEVCTCLVIKD